MYLDLTKLSVNPWPTTDNKCRSRNQEASTFHRQPKSSWWSVGHNTYDKSQSSKACDWHEKSSGLGCPTTNDCAVDGMLPHSELETAYPVSLMLGAVIVPWIPKYSQDMMVSAQLIGAGPWMVFRSLQ